MKRVIYMVMAVAVVAGVVLSPYSIIKTLSNTKELNTSLRQYVTAKAQLDSSKEFVMQAESDFNQSRTFEIGYYDVSRLVKVLNNVVTITVSSVNEADPRQNFAAGSAWSEGNESDAIAISLAVEDTASALRILEKMELPIYSIAITEPNIVTVTFLTGGVG